MKVHLPLDKAGQARQIAGVHLLRAGSVPEVSVVRVPSVLDHEVVAIDFVK